jgi:tRNA A37 methylthiotransferase MiaB
VAISSDFITGFCGETEEEHQETLSLMEQVRYDQAFMFAYSMREKTHAHVTMQDNVPEEVKQRRLREIIDMYHQQVHAKNTQQEVGRLRLVLVEGASKRSQAEWSGRTDQNKRIIFPVDDDGAALCWSDEHLFAGDVMDLSMRVSTSPRVLLEPGNYAVVEVTEAKGQSLRGRLLWRTTLTAFDQSGLAGIDAASLERAHLVRRQLLLDDEDSPIQNATASLL